MWEGEVNSGQYHGKDITEAPKGLTQGPSACGGRCGKGEVGCPEAVDR